jgi:hypothetical protein
MRSPSAAPPSITAASIMVHKPSDVDRLRRWPPYYDK